MTRRPASDADPPSASPSGGFEPGSPLDSAALAALVEARLGQPLFPDSAPALVRVTGGDRRALDTLLATVEPAAPLLRGPGGRAFELVYSGWWRLDADAAVRILADQDGDTAWSRLDDDGQTAVALVAELGDTDLAVLLDRFPLDTLRAAVGTGLLTTTRRAADEMRPDDRHPTVVGVAAWFSPPSGPPAAAAARAERVGRELAAAARRFGHDGPIADAQARRLVRSGPDGADQVRFVVDRADAALDRGDEELATELFAAVCDDQGTGSDGDEPMRRVRRRYALALDRSGRRDAAISIVDELRRDAAARGDAEVAALASADLASLWARHGQLGLAIAVIEEADAAFGDHRMILDAARHELAMRAGTATPPAGHPPATVPLDALATVGTWLMQGRPESALALIDEVDHGQLAELFAMFRALALADLGRIDEGLTEARRRRLAAPDESAWSRAWSGLALGSMYLVQGASATAAAIFADAAAQFARIDRPGERAWMTAAAAASSAKSGRTALARTFEIGAPATDQHDLQTGRAEVERHRAIVDLFDGRPDRAHDRQRAAIDWAIGVGHFGTALRVASDLATAGGLGPGERGPGDDDRVAALLRAPTEGGLCEARKALLVAATADDLDGLAAVARQTGEWGAHSLAVDTWLLACRRGRATGDHRANGFALRVAATRAHGADPITPSDDVDGPDVLSEREVDVARRVAAGRDRASVAAELFIARRTVDRHLNAAYRKLGVGRAAEVAEALAATGNGTLDFAAVDDATTPAGAGAELSALDEVAEARARVEAAGRPGAATPGPVERATWHVLGGLDADPEVWLAAAEQAGADGDAAGALRFARAAGDRGIDHLTDRQRFALAIVEITAHNRLGQYERAARVAAAEAARLEAGRPDGAGEAVERLGRLVTIDRLLLFHTFSVLGDDAATTARLDALADRLERAGADPRLADAARIWRATLLADQANRLTERSRFDEAADLAHRALAQPGIEPAAAVWAHRALGVAAWEHLDGAAARHHLDRALTLTADVSPSGRDRLAVIVTGTMTPIEIDAGDAVAARDAAATRRAGQPPSTAELRPLTEVSVGEVALVQGHLVEAAAACSAALDGPGEATPRLRLRAATNLIRAHAQRGAPVLARAVTRRLDEANAADREAWAPQILRAEAWTQAAGGRFDAAVASMTRAMAAAAERGARSTRAWTALDRFRLLPTVAHGDDLVAAVGPAGGVFATMRRLGEAAGGTATAWADSAEEWRAAGFDLLAAEALAVAADRSLPDRHQAGRLVDASKELAAACGFDAAPPMTIGSWLPGLTRRQRQIAWLATAGHGNADIAERLGLSVRTVANQLQRVYDVTGSGRDTLGG